MNSTRVTGILFLSAFLAYGIGASIGSTLLMLLNSAIVIAIGVLLYPTIATHNQRVAVDYLSARLWEGMLLGIGAVSLLGIGAVSLVGGAALNPLPYQAGMAGLGIGSVVLFWMLLRTSLLPAGSRLGVSSATGSSRSERSTNSPASPESACGPRSRADSVKCSSASGSLRRGWLLAAEALARIKIAKRYRSTPPAKATRRLLHVGASTPGRTGSSTRVSALLP